MTNAANDTDGSVYEDEAASGNDTELHKLETRYKADPPAVEPPSKKKKRRCDAGDDRARRYRKLYSHGYRNVYNSDVADAVDFLSATKPSRAPPTQIGASTWTTVEKQRLFSALERHSRGQIRELTSAIETKSESQVREYLSLLQQGAVEVFLGDRKFDYKPIRLFEIPAAYEISEECCKKLDEASTALSWYQYSFEARQEQEKHGEFWLLTPAIADQIEEAVPKAEQNPKKKRWDRYEAYQSEKDPDQDLDEEEDEEEEEEEEEDLDADAKTLLRSVPAAYLLDLPQWINLSQNVFMNAGGDRADENWRSIIEEDGEMGIFNTAYSDFHRLAVSVTKRIVAAALNQASSRLRATDRNYDHAAKPSVSTRDVITALDVLNMPKSAKGVWIKIPARCGVQVYSQGKNGAYANVLDYDQVERELGGNPLPTRSRTRNEDFVDCTEDGPYNYHSASRSAKENGEQKGEDNEAKSDKNDSEDEYEDVNEATEVQEYEEKMDVYAEDHDKLQSQLEEARMWEALGLPAPEVSQKEREKPPRKPRFATDVDDLLDWRELVDYKAPWERFGRPITEAAFEETQRSLVERTIGRSRMPSRTQAAEAPWGNQASTNNVASEGGDIGLQDGRAQDHPLQSVSEQQQDDPVPEADHKRGPPAEHSRHDKEHVPGKDQMQISPAREPRRAKVAATKSMAELPPYPAEQSSTGDD